MSQVFGEKVAEFGLALQGSHQKYITSEQKVWEKRADILFLETSLLEDSRPGLFQNQDSGLDNLKKFRPPGSYGVRTQGEGFQYSRHRRCSQTKEDGREGKMVFSLQSIGDVFCLWELEDCSRHGLRSLTCDPHLCFYSLHVKLSASHTSTISAHPQCRIFHKGKFVDVLFLIGPPHLPLHVKLVHDVHKCSKHT